MHHTKPSSQNTPTSDVPLPEYQINSNTYRQCENGFLSQQCSACGRWIGLGPKGGEWPFRLHVNSTSCAKERKKKASGTAHLVSKSTSCSQILTSPSSPVITPTFSAPTYPFAPEFHTPLPPQPVPSASPLSLRTSSWSAPSLPQICSTPSSTWTNIPLPSLTLESSWHSQQPVVLPPQKMCPGSLVLWEHGDPAMTYPFNLHSQELKSSVKLPWMATVGERAGSLRLRSDNCGGICNTLQPCCHPCAKITSSTEYQRVEDHAKNDHKHRAYDILSWKQMTTRTREKSSLLVKQ